MLWNVTHLWNQGSWFAFNCYRHWVRCLVRTEPGHPPLVIHSQEGITQGDRLAMSLYGVALMPLASRMRETIPEALQPWYCNDAAAAGKALPNARCLDFVVKFGPQYGYFPEPVKSYYICKAEDEDAALAGNVADMSRHVATCHRRHTVSLQFWPDGSLSPTLFFQCRGSLCRLEPTFTRFFGIRM